MFGRLVHPDARDASYPMRGVVALTTDPARTSRSWFANGWWGNQRPTSICVAYSWAHWLEDGPVPQPGTAPVVDPSHLYREAQKIDEWPGEGYDGTSVRAGAKVLQSMGYIASYHWGTTLDEVVRALLHVGPVVVGTNWYAGMMTPDAQALIRPQGSIVGGHAYVLDGVNTKTRLVRVKNSWGRTWGKKGFAYLTFGALEQLIREDGEACLALESSKP